MEIVPINFNLEPLEKGIHRNGVSKQFVVVCILGDVWHGGPSAYLTENDECGEGMKLLLDHIPFFMILRIH